VGKTVNQQKTKHTRDPRLTELRMELARRIAEYLPVEGAMKTEIPALSLHRHDSPSPCNPLTYEPNLSVFLQGRKRLSMGETTYLCDESTFLLTSVDVPVVSQIFASKEVPYLALRLALVIPLVREIINREDLPEPKGSSHVRGIAVGKTTAELFNAFSRLLDLLDTPDDIPFLSKTIQGEIIYRLLRGPQGERLRAIATSGDQSHRTAKAIAWLVANFNKRLNVEDLADMARMGASTFNRHFRMLTAMSPVQYQKQLRLNAARERMLTGGLDAASAAFEVGYESASQFSREYKRFFGRPPMRDIKAVRDNKLVPINAA
jgi:AraC-like DNA-binding protein